MPFVLETFSVDDVRPCSEELKALPQGGTVAADAQSVCEYLHRSLVDGDGRPACALVRLYETQKFGALEAALQSFARGLLDEDPADDMRCLTLLGTAGDEPAWNDRAQSVGHRAIPLPTEEFVERLPMVARLITQMGLELGVIVDPPQGSRAMELAHRTNDVFHVEHAAGSPYLPAQDFVAEHGVASAVGFGGLMLSGDFFAVVLFAKVPISDSVARTLKILAQPLRIRFLPFVARLGARR